MATVIGLQIDSDGNPIVDGKSKKEYSEADVKAKIEKVLKHLQKENEALHVKIKELEGAAKKGADSDAKPDSGSSEKNSEGSKKK